MVVLFKRAAVFYLSKKKDYLFFMTLYRKMLPYIIYIKNDLIYYILKEIENGVKK